MKNKDDEFFEQLEQQQPVNQTVKKKVRETASVEELLKLNFKKKLKKNLE